LIVGVSNAPLFGELAYAQVGGGACLNDRPLHVSEIRELSAATLSFGNIKTLAAGRSWQALAGLIGQLNRTRGYGDFYHYHLLAAGKIEIVIESDINILDVAALSLLIQEAGGRVTDFHGRKSSIFDQAVIASNGRIHRQIQKILLPR